MTAPFGTGYRALVIGASGGLGAAFVHRLQADPDCAEVVGLHRRSDPPLDFEQEASIGAAAKALSHRAPFQLIVNAAGILHSTHFMPEKQLGDLNYAQLEATFRINTFGPALLIRHFAPLLGRGPALMAMLSAKVGSIGDNRLGGWTSYRASKAALNMVVRTAAIELRRRQPQAVLVALHPGTVDTALSAPFRGAKIGRPPDTAASELLQVLGALSAEASGSFLGWHGEPLPW